MMQWHGMSRMTLLLHAVIETVLALRLQIRQLGSE